MPSPILARADALMQRRHQNNAEQNDLPILTDAIEDESDDEDGDEDDNVRVGSC